MKFLLLFACAALCLSSCAYVQSHKAVEESFCEYEGYQLGAGQGTKPELVQSGEKYYVGAEKVSVKKEVPWVYDSVFMKGRGVPSYKAVQGSASAHCYHPVSTGTAMVLCREDGYADMQALSDELATVPGSWVPLPRAQQVPVKAEFVSKGEPLVLLPDSRTPRELPWHARLLSGADLLFIDAPATVVYNVAIPFMAPFVFFKEFLTD